MADKGWVLTNLENALETCNEKFSEMIGLVQTSPENFMGGKIWTIMKTINGAVASLAGALIVIFFLIGIMKSCSNFAETKRPEIIFKGLFRLALSEAVVVGSMRIIEGFFGVAQAIIIKILAAANVKSGNIFGALPKDIETAINDCSYFDKMPLYAVTLIGSLAVTILCWIMIMTVYGRFFKLYMYTALAPLPLSTFAGESTSHIGKSFLKSYAAVCLEGAIIVLALIIFTQYASAGGSTVYSGDAVNIVWKYVGNLAFNLLVLVGAVKMSDRIVKEMMGL